MCIYANTSVSLLLTKAQDRILETILKPHRTDLSNYTRLIRQTTTMRCINNIIYSLHDYADLYPFGTNVSFDEGLNDKNYNRYTYTNIILCIG